MGRLVRAAAAGALVLAVLGSGSGPIGAQQEGTDVVTAFVAPGSQTDKDGGYYVLEAEPGETITQTVVVRNDRPHEIEAHVEAVDAFTRDATGAGYGAPGDAPEGTGSWIVVSTPVLTLQPDEQREVTFTVHVPEDAKPGQYLAGISASVPLPAPPPTDPGRANVADVSITLQGQRLIAVEVDVPGPRAAKLAVTGVRPVATPDGLGLILAMKNDGNAFAKGHGTVRVDTTGLQTGFDIDTFVSNTDIDYRVVWTDDVLVGTHPVAVRLDYDDRQVSWNGTVEIDASLQRQLEKEIAEMTVPESGNDGLPLPLIGAALLVTALLIVGATVMRRRRGGGTMRLSASH
jgi:hypothetical protein